MVIRIKTEIEAWTGSTAFETFLAAQAYFTNMRILEILKLTTTLKISHLHHHAEFWS